MNIIRNNCIYQGGSQWCFLASYLTIAKHKSPKIFNNLRDDDLSKKENNTFKNIDFLTKIFNQMNLQININLGFKYETLNLLKSITGCEIQTAINYEKFSSLKEHKNKYIILHFKKNGKNHFCVLVDIIYKKSKIEKLFFFDPASYGELKHEAIIEDQDINYNSDGFKDNYRKLHVFYQVK